MSTLQRDTEKIARELALRSKHKNEGLWELMLPNAYLLLQSEPLLAEKMMAAYDARGAKRRRAKTRKKP